MKTNTSKKFLYHRFSRMFGRALLVTLVAITPLHAMEQAQAPKLAAATSLAAIATTLATPAAPTLAQETSTKRYVCDICGKALACSTPLKRHKLKHTGEKPFKCNFDGCDYASKQLEHLKTHKLTHTGEKPFKCDFNGCKYAYTSSSSLKTHKLTHTGEKPFKCDHPGCDYACKELRHLKTHKLTHTGEKPYKRTHQDCTKCFTKANSVLDHVRRKHTHEKLYGCDHPNCQYTCVKLGELRRHKKKKHNVTNSAFIRLQPQQNPSAQENNAAQQEESSSNNEETRPFTEYAMARGPKKISSTTRPSFEEKTYAYERPPQYTEPTLHNPEQQPLHDKKAATLFFMYDGEITPPLVQPPFYGEDFWGQAA
ncbi:MAG: C2H2-type zinc finger protein, partial [Hydrogenophaga sp.]|nr:C2H2-type zinc finger protein [Hydrogenophaga sp.]